MTSGCAALGFSTWGLFQPVVSDALVVLGFGSYIVSKTRQTQAGWS